MSRCPCVSLTPLRKRRRTGVSHRDLHTVYMTDTEDEDEGESDVKLEQDDDSIKAEEQEYASDTSSEEVETELALADKREITVKGENNRVKIDRKRAYWASKGKRSPD